MAKLARITQCQSHNASTKSHCILYVITDVKKPLCKEFFQVVCVTQNVHDTQLAFYDNRPEAMDFFVHCCKTYVNPLINNDDAHS